MALLDGKQIRNESTSLDKLQGHSGLVTFTSSATMSFENGAVLRRETADILVATDVVNKEYVDSVAAGLDPKESVKVIATSSVVLSGTSSVDGYVLQLGDRILINGQDGVNATASNGIYVVSAGTWSRATDSDGTPFNEVSYGNFVFVEEGTVYGGSGWVLSISDSSDSYILVGTESQLWVQFSSAGYYTAGAGLSLVGSEFSITNTGVSANTYGASNQAVTFTVNSRGQLTSASTQSIAITSGQVTDFDSAAQTSIFTDSNFVDGITVTFSVTAGDSVTAEVVDGSLGTSKLDTDGAGATAGYILSNDGSGNFVWIVNDAGDITEVTAGVGLTGGGVSGAVTLDVQTTNGVSIVGDSVALGGTLSQNTTIAGAGYDFTLGNADIILMTGSTFDVEADGFISLDAGTGSVQILANDNVIVSGATVDMTGTFSINTVIIDPVGALNGQALIYDGTKFAPATISGDISGVTAGAGLSGGGSSGFIQLDVELTTNGGLTFSGAGDSGTLQVDYTSVAENLQGNGLTANGGVLDVNVANGISIVSDVVELGGTLTKNTIIDANLNDLSIGDLNTLTFTASGSPGIVSGLIVDGTLDSASLTVTDSLGSIFSEVRTNHYSATITAESNGVSNTLAFFNNPQTLGGLDGSSGNYMLVKDNIASKGLVYVDDYTANFTTYSLVTKGYVDQQILSAGTITAVNGGAGLTGGGTAGSITLDVNTGNGIFVNNDVVEINPTAAGNGLTFSTGVFAVNTANGLQISGDNVEVAPSIAGTGLTFSAGVLSVIAGNAKPVYSQRNLTPSNTPDNTNNANSGLTITNTPNDYSRVSVYVNGQLQYLGNGTASNVDCYFGLTAGVAESISNITSGQTLWWNGGPGGAGFRLQTSDRIDIIYEV